MKLLSTLSLVASLSFASASFAPSAGMDGTEMKAKGMKNCMDMKGMKGMEGMDMKGMDMKDMDPQKCKEMMKGMNGKKSSKTDASASHRTHAMVKSIDVAQGKVTLAHDPVKSLGWPAMTMGFAVKDKSLFDKLAVGKKVHVQFRKEDAGYVVTAVQ